MVIHVLVVDEGKTCVNGIDSQNLGWDNWNYTRAKKPCGIIRVI